jgi:hypothetical protein
MDRIGAFSKVGISPTAFQIYRGGHGSCPGRWADERASSKSVAKDQTCVFVFLSFLAVAFAVGWIMYPLPL